MARTSTATAPVRPVRRSTTERRGDRPPLRVVDPSELQRLKPARVGTIAGVLLFVALFALAAFQTVLIKSQSRLDELNDHLDAERERQEQLELELADLRSPERITAAAQDRLGMLAPYEVTFIQPSPDDDERARYVDPAAPSPPDPAAEPADRR